MTIKRFYPQCCTSMYCGEFADSAACLACSNRPTLDEFKAWVKQTQAIKPDPIWSPNCYVAQV